MSRGEEFGVDEIKEIILSHYNGTPHFIIKSTGEEIRATEITGKRGYYLWDKSLNGNGRDLTDLEVESFAKRHAPYEATFFLRIMEEDNRTLSHVRYRIPEEQKYQNGNHENL